MNHNRLRNKTWRDFRGTARLVLIAVVLGVLTACLVLADQRPQAPTPRIEQLRRPIAAAFLSDGTLCVANQRSGSVSLVDVRQSRVRSELALGGRLTDLAVLPDRKHVLLVDEARHELIALSFDGEKLSVHSRLPVARYPASVAVLADGKRATVASLWSRRLQVVDLAPLASSKKSAIPNILHTIRLPFSPRNQCALPGGSRVVVADAFGGRLALVDIAAGRLMAVHEFPGHNLRGMVVSADGKQLRIAHQILDQESPVLEEKIWRGILLKNVIRSIPLAALREPGTNLDKTSEVLSLKSNGIGAGDPSGLTGLSPEQYAVALAGVDEIALIGTDGDSVRRVSVGRRPTAIVRGAAGQPALVLNTFDDSLSVVDPQRGLVLGTIALGRQPALTSADRGELLFFDAHLSRDGWMSCHSCHTDGHTNGLLADTMGDGTHGTPKRTLTLRGTALTDPWGWNGSMKYLQDQIEKSLRDTMHAPTFTGHQVNDLLTYLHTLPPPPPLEPITEDKADRKQVERGRQLFHERKCVLCHIPPLTYSSHGTHDVGFADEHGLRQFNAPSLRGVSQGHRFLHDNRAATLEEVFTQFHHKVGRDMPAEELSDLLRFLRSL